MPLRKRPKQAVDSSAGSPAATRKKSKRQRLADLFRLRRHKEGNHGQEEQDVPIKPLAAPPEPPRDSKIADSPKPREPEESAPPERNQDGNHDQNAHTQPNAPPDQEPQHAESHDEPPPPPPLSEEHIRALFSGAPHFARSQSGTRSSPTASFPWDMELRTRDVSDSVQLSQPAFSAATLRRHLPILQQSSEQEKQYQIYHVDVVEVPSMLSAQGLEPGSIGFVHFLELPQSDSLVTDLQQSQSSNGFLEITRNKEQMQNNPERLGIRPVDMSMAYDRLIEIGDLIEAFQDSPRRMTLLNNQSSGDLYAHLFGKFLTPPPYDDNADDPTGMKVQIDTLLKILRLKGVWYDFSLVEWRIRLGQLLWSEDDAAAEEDSNNLWSERETLLLQITLACELLLRLDAVTSMDADEVKAHMHVTRADFEGFLQLETTKTKWDLVLAQRFLDNILIVKAGDGEPPQQTSKSRGLFSILSRDQRPSGSPDPDIVLLPRHQSRQLSGLIHFAETLRWPGLDLVVTELALKLQVTSASETAEPPAAPYGGLLDPSTPSSMSVYATPLASPRSAKDNYFGHVARPPLSRNSSRAVTVPLATQSSPNETASNVLSSNIGGWLSRSYLTGLILPGEAIAHLLMSTLLENDKLAIASLGESANLYGGFIYSERSWWSKTSIVGRVLACIEGTAECMGWISPSRLPVSQSDGWFAVDSQQVPFERPARISADEDVLARDAAIIPGEITTNVEPKDLALPCDAESPPVPSIEFKEWHLVASNSDLPENEEASTTPTDAIGYAASLTFQSFGRDNTFILTLTHDVQFVSSFPCTPPSRSDGPSTPHVVKNPLPRTSSTKSIHSTRSSTNRLSRHLSRRNSHGYEPLLSHPPDSPSIGPTRIHTPIQNDNEEENTAASAPKLEPMPAHPLHISYTYRICPVSDVLDPSFDLPFKRLSSASPEASTANTPAEEKTEEQNEENTILILDARSSRDLELLARAWCAENGLHALIGRVGRTCLACCVREARGLGVNIVIRV